MTNDEAPVYPYALRNQRIPATPEHEKKLRKAMLRLIDRRIREIFRLRFYCKTHDGCLLEHMEENEHE